MTDQFFSTPAALARLQVGPLGPHVDLFASLLSKRGYAKGTIRRQLRAVADLSHWLEEQGLRIDDLDEESLSGFEEQAPRSREVVRKLRAVYPILLEHLREIGVVAEFEPSPSGSALDCALHDFSQYLAEQRSLAQTTITRYRRVIRDFLGERFGSGPIVPAELSGPKKIGRPFEFAPASEQNLNIRSVRGTAPWVEERFPHWCPPSPRPSPSLCGVPDYAE